MRTTLEKLRHDLAAQNRSGESMMQVSSRQQHTVTHGKLQERSAAGRVPDPVSRREFISGTTALPAAVAFNPVIKATAETNHAGQLTEKAFEKARERASAIVNQMTLEEVAGQLGNSAPALPRVGLQNYQYWTEARAILCSLFAGERQGDAIADAIFGDYNPGGKLCSTWYRDVNQLPNFHDYDIKHGRTYMYFRGEPIYAFGHGLSYTSFDYQNVEMSSTSLSKERPVTISVEVANTGQRSGDEVVQLYVQAEGTERPIKQ